MGYSCDRIGKMILKLREKRNLTQEMLGKKIGYSGKQISNYETGKALPSIEVMLSLCTALNCEPGYLLGGESYSEGTLFETRIYKETGLSTDAQSVVRYITGTEPTSLLWGHEHENIRRILNNLLVSEQFPHLIEQLLDLDYSFAQLQNYSMETVMSELGDDRLNAALENWRLVNGAETNLNLTPEELSDALRIDECFDKTDEYEYRVKILRYEARETFENLIESLYPRNSGTQKLPVK